MGQWHDTQTRELTGADGVKQPWSHSGSAVWILSQRAGIEVHDVTVSSDRLTPEANPRSWAELTHPTSSSSWLRPLRVVPDSCLDRCHRSVFLHSIITIEWVPFVVREEEAVGVVGRIHVSP